MCLVPMFLWCVSGLTHPIMANWFRVQPAHRTAPITHIDHATVKLTLQQVLEKNKITDFNNIGIKQINQQWYYSIEKEGALLFFSVKTGEELIDGDEVYAKELASYYLGKAEVKAVDVNIVHQFTQEYKLINRHLPVYKVSFNDKAKSDVFVHLPSGGLGTINDGFKRTQLWMFSNFHNWSFLGDNHTVKPFFVFVFSAMSFVVGVLGLYIYFVNRKKYKKRKKGNSKLKQRNIHRYISVPASVFYLMFSFSGAYHALQKFEKYFLNQYQPVHTFKVEDVNQNFLELPNLEQLQRISLVKIKGEIYYRVAYYKNPKASYYKVQDLEHLINADEVYAKQRAQEITGLNTENLNEVSLITRYQQNYGFINKRLPVYHVQFNDDLNTQCFVETASGIPGAVVNKVKKREALSFIMLHKFHFLDPIGKGNRDIIIGLAVLAIVFVMFSGLRVFLQTILNR